MQRLLAASSLAIAACLAVTAQVPTAHAKETSLTTVSAPLPAPSVVASANQPAPRSVNHITIPKEVKPAKAEPIVIRDVVVENRRAAKKASEKAQRVERIRKQEAQARERKRAVEQNVAVIVDSPKAQKASRSKVRGNQASKPKATQVKVPKAPSAKPKVVKKASVKKSQTTVSQKRRGKSSPRNWAYAGQCTWGALEKWRSATGYYLGGFYGNAKDWGYRAAGAGHSVGTAPRARSVVVMQPGVHGSGSAGHVAWVTSVSGNRVTYVEMNGLAGPYNWSTRTVTHTGGMQYIYAP